MKVMMAVALPGSSSLPELEAAVARFNALLTATRLDPANARMTNTGDKIVLRVEE